MVEGTLQSTSKVCSECKELKDLSLFPEDKRHGDGYRCQCKECEAIKEEKRCKQNKEYCKTYYNQNKEKLRARSRKYYWQNREKALAQKQGYHQARKSEAQHMLAPMLRGARRRAQVKKLPFDLTIEWLETMIVSHCPITLQPIDWLREQVVDGNAGPNSPSIDRNKPELGYIQSNCSIISYRGNRIKNDGTMDEHLRAAQYMAAQQLRDTEF